MSQPDRPPTTSGSTTGVARRLVIRSAGLVGVGVVGAATLAACGGDTNSASTATSPAAARTAAQARGGSSAGGGAAGQIKVAVIPVGGGKVFDAEKVVVTQPKVGEFKAFSAICTHQGCTVATVANGTINCPCHGTTYDMATGAVTGGPASTPLPGRTTTVKGGSITVS